MRREENSFRFRAALFPCNCITLKSLAFNLSVSSSTGNFWVQSRESYRHSIDKKEPQGGNRSDCFNLLKTAGGYELLLRSFSCEIKNTVTDRNTAANVWLTCTVLDQAQLVGLNGWQHEKKREGQTLVTLKKNVAESVLLLIWSFVVSVFSIKTRKGGLWLVIRRMCEPHWTLEQCFKQAQEENILVFTVQVGFFLGHGWPDKCTEWWSTFQL